MVLITILIKKMIIIIIRIRKMIRINSELVSEQHILHARAAAGGVVDAAFDHVGFYEVVQVTAGGYLGEADACGNKFAGEVFTFMFFETVGNQVQGFALESFLEFDLFGLFGQVSVI